MTQTFTEHRCRNCGKAWSDSSPDAGHCTDCVNQMWINRLWEKVMIAFPGEMQADSHVIETAIRLLEQSRDT